MFNFKLIDIEVYMEKYKLHLRIYELEGVGSDYKNENLTLGVLTQIEELDKEVRGFKQNKGQKKNTFDFDTLHFLLSKRFGDKLHLHCKIDSEKSFLLSSKLEVSEDFLDKAMREIETLLQGVEIFLVDRNLGYLQDIPVFDKRKEEILADKKTTSWVLMSDAKSLGGTEKYDNCPELISFIKESSDGRENIITYTKKTPESSYVGIEFSKLIAQKNEYSRHNKFSKPKEEEELKSALSHLVKALESNAKPLSQ